ncbi:znf644 [Pungitius sinensis]
MSDLRRNAREDKDVQWLSDSPGRTQEPLQSHTFSPKNNAAGLSSDEHENPLNGTQPNPFVYSGAPAVPHAGNSLPSGALVNGPGSHPTSEVHCVLNKGTVLSNNVLDAAWQAGTDTSPEVLPPPSELQSDAWKNTAGPVLKTLATQPGVNTPLSHSEENESKLACPAPSGAGGAEQMHISQPLTKQTTKTGSRRDVERSGSSSDDREDAEAVGWESASERNDRRLETRVMHRGDRKHNTHAKSMSASLKKVNSSLNHTHRHACFCSDAGNVDVANQTDAVAARSGFKDSAVPLKGLSRNTVSDSRDVIYSTAAQEGRNEQNDPEDEDNCTSKEERLRTEKVQRDPLFFSCTTCNVNFKQRRHFHRHMMYHLSKHNQVNVSHPFICRECGRLFCDRSALMRHGIIHRDGLGKIPVGVENLKNPGLEDGAGATVRCPRRPAISVQHAKTRDNLKHYYFCEECNYITLTQQALEAHLDTHRPQHGEMARANEAEAAGRVRYHFFTSSGDAALEGRCELERLRWLGNCQKVADRPDPNLHRSTGERPHFSHRSGKKGDDTAVNATPLRGRVGCTENTPPPSVWRVDRHGKLLLQTAAQSDAAKDLTCVEEHNDCEAFGSSRQATCPAPADVLPSAGSPTLVQELRQGGGNNHGLHVQANPNDPSLGKRSTPLQSTIANGGVSAWFSQRFNKPPANKEAEKGRSDDTRSAARRFLESRNARNPYARRYFTKRHRYSAEDQSPRVLKDEEEGGEDCSDIEQLIIKEELMDTAACDDCPQSPRMSAGDTFDVFPTPALEHKRCPYCPATFESGVGLSNHVRGHLHRVGLSYNARHVVSPEQVALQDHQPRTRRRIPRGTRRMIKGVNPETQAEHKCPLCRGWFDTKTGLTNHVRGHLKRIGTSVSSTGKSPLCMLKELLRGKKEHQNTLQVLDKRKPPSGVSSDGLILMHMGVPVKIRLDMRSPRSTDSLEAKQEPEAFSDRRLQVEAQRGPEASSSILVELLGVRQQRMELSARSKQEDWKPSDFTKDYTQAPDWAHEPCDASKICIQCNGAVPGLPGHLRAYAHRKRMALLEGPGCDYKPKKPRPGLKKGVLPSLNAENYTFTCRFCDLVFQGPLSVQEDWIKHLQRHLLHTGVPHSGTGMVEVLGLRHDVHMSICRD